MIPLNYTEFTVTFAGQHQTNQGTLQALQGQAVFIQGQPSANGQTQVVQGQAIMLQNQNNLQGQVQLVTTSSSTGTQQLQIVPQVQKQAGKNFFDQIFVIS